jgi:DNA-binding transcriptional MerR regulator
VSEPVQFLSPTETSRRLGVSVRALRLYERHGLVRPGRTAAGWRVYGPDQIARLHQVLALKGLGLPLARIAELLSGRTASLGAILAFQEEALGRRRDEMERALQAIRSARARLARNQTLSLDELTNLTRETQMTEPMTAEDWSRQFEPLWRKHLSPEEYDRMFDAKVAAVAALGLDAGSFGAAWQTVIADAERAMVAQDYTSDAVRATLARWNELANVFAKEEPGLQAKSAAIWQEALATPGLGPNLPINQQLWSFMTEVKRRIAA